MSGRISIHPKKEPVAWIGLGIIILQIVSGVFTHNIDTSLFTSLITAFGAVGIRQTVWSLDSHYTAVNNVVQKMAAVAVSVNPISTGSTMTENTDVYNIPEPSEFPDGDQLDSIQMEATK